MSYPQVLSRSSLHSLSRAEAKPAPDPESTVRRPGEKCKRIIDCVLYKMAYLCKSAIEITADHHKHPSRQKKPSLAQTRHLGKKSKRLASESRLFVSRAPARSPPAIPLIPRRFLFVSTLQIIFSLRRIIVP